MANMLINTNKGDISDSEEALRAANAKPDILRFSIETLAHLLSRRFPSLSVVVLSCKMTDGLFVDHGILIRGNVFDKLQSEVLKNHHPPFTLIGYSKGSVVLGEIVNSVNQTNYEAFKSVTSLIWVDGNVFPSGSKNLSENANFFSHIRFVVQSTPRQVRDPLRPWIRAQKDMFIELLEENSHCYVDEIFHMGEPPSMDMHYCILEEFNL